MGLFSLSMYFTREEVLRDIMPIPQNRGILQLQHQGNVRWVVFTFVNIIPIFGQCRQITEIHMLYGKLPNDVT